MSLWVSGCGLQTPPQPLVAPPELKWVKSFSVRQRGDQIRLAWSLGAKLPIPPSPKTLLRFRILPYRLTYPCLACEPIPEQAIELSPEQSVRLKSRQEWRMDFPVRSGDLHTPAYALEVWHPEGGLVERTPRVALQARTLFPRPAAPSLQWLASGAVRISWRSPSNPRAAPKTPESPVPLWYAANVYGATNQSSLSEALLNAKPVSVEGWLFLPPKESGDVGGSEQGFSALAATRRPARSAFWIDLPAPPEDTWYLSLRWVDRFGNESSASEPATIFLPATTPPHLWRMFWPTPLAY